jgi:hypothetical protein
MIEDDASKIIYNSDEDNSSSFEECLDNDLQVRKVNLKIKNRNRRFIKVKRILKEHFQQY